MTTQNSNPTKATRSFSPIFNAVVTPASVKNPTAKNGSKYAVMKGATVAQAGKEAKIMTVMAFGKSRDNVAGLLRKGRPVELAVQFDGGSLKVIGLPRAKAA